MTNVEALAATVEARGLDRPGFAVVVEHVRNLAAQLDERPANSVLLRAYLPAVRVLLSLGDEPTDEESESFLRMLATPTRAG